MKKTKTINSFFNKKTSSEASPSSLPLVVEKLPLVFEQDPGLRPQIWEYLIDQQDEMRRAYVKAGSCQHKLLEYPSSVSGIGAERNSSRSFRAPHPGALTFIGNNSQALLQRPIEIQSMSPPNSRLKISISPQRVQAVIAFRTLESASKACKMDGHYLEGKRLIVFLHKTISEREEEMEEKGHVFYPPEPGLKRKVGIVQKTVRNMLRRVDNIEDTLDEVIHHVQGVDNRVSELEHPTDMDHSGDHGRGGE